MLSGRLLDSHWTKTNSDLELDLQRRLAERHTAIAFPAPPVPGGGAAASVAPSQLPSASCIGWWCSCQRGPIPTYQRLLYRVVVCQRGPIPTYQHLLYRVVVQLPAWPHPNLPAPPVPGGGASAGIGSASRAPSPGSGWSAAAGPPPWRPPGWPSCPEHSCPARRARACPCTPQRVRGVDPARACPCKQWFRVWVQLVHAPASNGSGCGSSSCMPLQAMVQGVDPARACPCKQWFRAWVQLVHAPASNGSGCGSSSCMPLQAMVQGVGPARACPFTPDTAIRHCIYYSDTVFFSLFCVCCWGPRL